MRRAMASTVSYSAGLLDTIRPGWHNDIHVETLNMTHSRYCIIGQLYGSYIYNVGRVILQMMQVDTDSPFIGKLTDEEWTSVGDSHKVLMAAAEFYGFTLSPEYDELRFADPWNDLQKLWVAEINSRREAEDV